MGLIYTLFERLRVIYVKCKFDFLIDQLAENTKICRMSICLIDNFILESKNLYPLLKDGRTKSI